MKTNLRNLILLTALLIPLGLLFTGCPKATNDLNPCDGDTGELTGVTTFKNTLNDAKLLHDSSYEGTNPGNYSVGSKAILQAAIDMANAILDKDCVHQDELDTATNALQQAIADFEAKKIPPDGGGDGEEG